MKFSWKESAFDTEILGVKTAKITSLDPHLVTDLKKDLQKYQIQYATYRISADDYPAIQNLEKYGFIFVDGLITLEACVKNDNARFSSIEIAGKEDEDQLIYLASTMYRGISRYYHDPVISQKKADSVYQQWMKNSLAGKVADAVLIWKEKKDILGFITLQKKGEIPLIGVAKKARGKGIGKILLSAAFSQFSEWGLEKITIETQMTNFAALCLYQSCGFTVSDASLTFRWSAS